MHLKPPTLLLVEDDAADAELARLAFEKGDSKFHFQLVRHGGEAIDYLVGKGAYHDRERFPFPNMMLLDIHLPIVDGFAVLQWIKENPIPGRLWVMVLSGAGYEQGRTPVLENHGNVTICRAQFLKPITPEMVETMLSILKIWQKLPLIEEVTETSCPSEQPISVES